jgi:hypothetical protein
MQARLVLRKAESAATAPATPQGLEGAAVRVAGPGRPLALLPIPKAPGVPVRGHVRRTEAGAVTVRPHGRVPTERRLPPAPPAGTGEPKGEQLALEPRPDGCEPVRVGSAQLSLAAFAPPVALCDDVEAAAAVELRRAEMMPLIERGEMPPAAMLRAYDEAMSALQRVVSHDPARYDEVLKQAAAMEGALRATRPRR